MFKHFHMRSPYAVMLVFLGMFAVFVLYNTYQRAFSPPFVPDEKITKDAELRKVLFAGGCFWCTESEFNHVAGVASAISGYADADSPNPSYEEVSSKKVKAREAVAVYYDPNAVSFEDLLLIYWTTIDPTDGGGQFSDRGFQYSPAIYYTSEDQRMAAEIFKQKINTGGKFEKPVAVEILPFSNFYPAEEYHQDYKDKNPVRYEIYREASGRNAFIRKHWPENGTSMNTFFGKATNTPAASWHEFTREKKDARLKELTPIQWEVTQREGTERPFSNEYDKNDRRGIYVDIVSGEPLFSSKDKYDSKTGWPSFVKPIEPSAVALREEERWFSVRTEVRSVIADSHLGHVFDDGPSDRGGKRYCMNSAALRFIPIEEMEKEGYGDLIRYVQ